MVRVADLAGHDPVSYSRDHFRHHEVTFQDVAARAPWRALPVAGLEPITIPVGGTTIRLSCAEMAAYAGLEASAPRRGWPEPGELAGCVAIASTYASALVPSAECVINKLYSHRLMSLQFIRATGLTCGRASLGR